MERLNFELMENKVKKIILLSALLLSSNLFAKELQNYDEVKSAVLNGQSIHINVDFTKCATAARQNAEDLHVASFTPTAIQIARDHIATSLTHFTLGNPHYPDKPIYEFIKYTINQNGILILNAQALNPLLYTPIGEAMTFTCKVGEGVRIFA